jgi:hypothetical protein
MTSEAGQWSALGHQDLLLWGSYQGSAAARYRTSVLLDGAGGVQAATCSCPSRQAPCKHAVALVDLRSADRVAEATPPDDISAWRSSRSRPVTDARSADPQAAAKRAAQRADRVRLGLEELDLWLADQVRAGLAALQRGGYGPVDQMAARMVDAQAPGVAGMLRALPARFVGDDWPARTLEQLALIRLLVAAHRRLDELPADLAATVRARVGYPTSRESVLAGPVVRDRWAVLGLVDVPDHRLTSRRVWLRGTGTGRWALLLSFAVGGASLDSSVLPGVTIDADLHFYPGAGEHRALLGHEHGRIGGVFDVPGIGVGEAARGFGALVTADPWAERLPVVLHGAPLPPGDGEDQWSFRGEDGLAVPMVPGVAAWPLLARSMGDPIDVAGEWTRRGFHPLGFLPHPLDPVFSTEVLSA